MSNFFNTTILSPILCAVFACSLIFPSFTFADRSFSVPEGLQNRVNFWIDVFTKHGKDREVLHHRNYPQAIFDVVDHSSTQGMSAGLRAKSKKALSKKRIEYVKQALTKLSKGGTPSTKLEKRVAASMALVPGDRRKYKEALSGGLVRGQTGIREKFKDAIIRSGRYMPTIERIFSDAGLPNELTRMPFIESSFDYKAYSSVGAAGIWQFMPRTGKLYKLRVDKVVDERRDPIAATRAATKYLKEAYGTLKTWPLAVTSYNHGPYGVKKAIKKFGTKDITSLVERPGKRPFGFASGNFYPEFLAALEVYRDRDFYFPNVQIEPKQVFDQIKLPYSFSISHLKKTLKVNEEDLKKLNYALSSNVWKGRYKVPSSYTLKVPPGFGQFAYKLQAKQAATTASNVYGGATYKVRKGDTLARISRKYGTSVSALKSLNGLKSDHLWIGQVLAVHAREKSFSSSSTSSQASTYRVRSGDTLGRIAQKYRTTVSKLKALNGLRLSLIHI